MNNHNLLKILVITKETTFINELGEFNLNFITKERPIFFNILNLTKIKKNKIKIIPYRNCHPVLRRVAVHRMTTWIHYTPSLPPFARSFIIHNVLNGVIKIRLNFCLIYYSKIACTLTFCISFIFRSHTNLIFEMKNKSFCFHSQFYVFLILKNK